MIRRIIVILAAVAAALVFTAPAVSANPGPGNSNQCAPGQHDGQGSADRPAVCDHK